MAENLGLYPKIDPNNRLTVVADRCDWDMLNRTDGATWLSSDFGVGAIVAGTAVTYIDQADPSSLSGLVAPMIWTNTNTDLKSLVDGGIKYTMFWQFGNTWRLRYADGLAVHDDATAALAFSTERLIATSRSGQVYTQIIYNGTTVGSGVLDTLTINAGETPPDFQYNIVVSNFADGVANSHSGHIRDINFTGLAGGVTTALSRNRIVNQGSIGPLTRGSFANN